jgi:flagellar biosynthesis chaperone FliJ
LNEKKNLVQIENAIDIVNQLNGYNYEWKNSDEKQIGLIAQEVEKVLPEAVSENEKGTKFLNYDGIIPVLTEAIKEQQKTIKKQNDRIEQLFLEIEKLKKNK